MDKHQTSKNDALSEGIFFQKPEVISVMITAVCMRFHFRCIVICKHFYASFKSYGIWKLSTINLIAGTLEQH